MTHEEQLRKLKNIMAQFVGFTGIKLPDDVIAKLKELSEKETDPMPKVIYETMEPPFLPGHRRSPVLGKMRHTVPLY